MIAAKVKEAWAWTRKMLREGHGFEQAIYLADAYVEAEWRRRKAEWRWFYSTPPQKLEGVWADDDWRAEVIKELNGG